MKCSEMPLWKRALIEDLNLSEIMSWLWEVGENGDMYGYDTEGESEYYYEYKDLFDDLSCGAYDLAEAIESQDQYVDEDIFNDIIVSALGELYKTQGYDSEEYDYFQILNEFESSLAQEEARERLMKMTKKNLIDVFCKSIKLLALFWDIKTAHDCLAAIVDELDYKGAILDKKRSAIDKLYEEYTGQDPEDFERRFEKIVEDLPQRMWVE